MAEAIRKYGILIIILGFILTVIFLWVLITRDDINKIPSRGVFVDNCIVRQTIL